MIRTLPRLRDRLRDLLRGGGFGASPGVGHRGTCAAGPSAAGASLAGTCAAGPCAAGTSSSPPYHMTWQVLRQGPGKSDEQLEPTGATDFLVHLLVHVRRHTHGLICIHIYIYICHTDVNIWHASICIYIVIYIIYR